VTVVQVDDGCQKTKRRTENMNHRIADKKWKWNCLFGFGISLQIIRLEIKNKKSFSFFWISLELLGKSKFLKRYLV